MASASPRKPLQEPSIGWNTNPALEQIRTTTTDLLKINHPVMLAGMNVAAGPKLAAAVSNAGGIGVIGGVGYTPDMLREQVAELKSYLKDKSAPFGVDLLLPQVGGSARKTNYDYTKGKLDELVGIIIDSGAKLFVSAVGVPPKHVVERLHTAGIFYMYAAVEPILRFLYQLIIVQEHDWPPKARQEMPRSRCRPYLCAGRRGWWSHR